jgi:RNA polymerase sigma-70 factor (ECF subfamily)
MSPPAPSEAFREAQISWPGLVLDPGRFEAFLAERGLAAGAIAPALARDGYLVCAVLAGVAGAPEALRRHTEPALREAVRKVLPGPDDASDVLQKLWESFLVGEAGQRRLAEWQAQGPLLAFLRVSAVRLALKTRRAQRPEPEDPEELLARQTSGLTPELSYLKESYRAVFREAFQESLDSLPSRDQLLLRQQILDGLTVDELGALHHVHRATVARWVAAARETLITRTRRKFFAALALGPDEGEGVMSLVRSRLDETIRRRLEQGR